MMIAIARVARFGLLFVLSLLCLFCSTVVAAPEPLEVMFDKGHLWALESGGYVELTNEVEFPGAIKVFTNATFKVAEGKARQLQEGQRLRPDGLLFSPDGIVGPVFDHLYIQGRKVTLFKDGEAQPLGAEMVLKNGTRMRIDGTFVRPNGMVNRLSDGHRVLLDGRVLPPIDTVVLRGNQVWVFKDGALIRVQPVQIMLMSEGSRVHGSGIVTRPDGSQYKLQEGQIVVLEGAGVRR
jgi:hypothetical protein